MENMHLLNEHRQENNKDQDELENLYKSILLNIGEDIEREGLQKTPLRAAKAIEYLTQGYDQKVEDVLNGALFNEKNINDMVIVKDIEFYSLCEHHILPFWGVCHVAYIPNGKIVGLSKIARLVNLYARRLQVQERLTHQIADTLFDVLNAEGVGVVIKAKHLCMMMRGVEKQNSQTVTSAMFGSFLESGKTRSEFLELIRNS